MAVIRPGDREMLQVLNQRLARYEEEVRPLPGIERPAYREVLIHQLNDSIRRVRFVTRIPENRLPQECCDPSHDAFNPLKAAVIHLNGGNLDEAFWLVFLATHFGKHAEDGWRLLRDIYGARGQRARWTWTNVSRSPDEFRIWLDHNQDALSTRRFSNHRKYESLNARSASGTGAVVASYVHWVNHNRGHQQFMDELHEEADGDAKEMFRQLYRSMSAVARFGRLGKFDFLTMVGKLGLAPITPGSTFMVGATGPKKGAQMLFDNYIVRSAVLDGWLIELGEYLDQPFGMQVIEDAICNWQKSPGTYKLFRG